ncbi:MAG TPA: OmpH family outer membrane protein [Candidatus Tidjanibacter gallistercoris]|nr:OmpH family outer membrane protein [Candidatus Tidjanibacter gallistercoris]
MKKFVLFAAMALFAAVGSASAQNYMVVNTETIFKSISAYNKAVEEMDAAAKQYQQNIDDAYAELEEMYETYMAQKASLSQSARQQREETILNNEKRITDYQAEVFGENGKMTKMQAEKLEPYQKKVMETISKYAADHGYSLVLDISTNPLVVYYNPAVDKTQDIISLLK